MVFVVSSSTAPPCSGLSTDAAGLLSLHVLVAQPRGVEHQKRTVVDRPEVCGAFFFFFFPPLVDI